MTTPGNIFTTQHAFSSKERFVFFFFSFLCPCYPLMATDKTLLPEKLGLLFALHFFYLAIAFMSKKTYFYEKCC